MKLSKQVVSLKLAKKLKELGVKQESLYWYVMNEDGKRLESEPHYARLENDISAFTVAELGEMLPSHIKIKERLCTIAYYSNEQYSKNYVEYESWEEDIEKRKTENTTEAKTEANARAKCLIYLLENKLIKHP